MIAIFLLLFVNGIQAQIETQAEKLYNALIAKDLNNAIVLAQNVDYVNKTFHNNTSLLMIASFDGVIEVCKILIDKEANLDLQASNGWTALIMASQNGNTEVVKLLLDKGAKFDTQSDFGYSALMAASFNGHIEIVKLLLDKGANINLQKNNGSTALMAASDKGHTEIVKLLIDKGANAELKTDTGKTAFDFAKKSEIQTLLPNASNESYSQSNSVSTNASVVYGSFTDKRDGNVYKTIKIGTQVWMAENLNYDAKNYCWTYNNDLSNANIYGRLYRWEVAREVCPVGWHLPSDDEWKILEQNIGISQSMLDTEGWRGDDEGNTLKTNSGWNTDGNGSNENGFSALPGGMRSEDGEYSALGERALFWTSTGPNVFRCWYRMLSLEGGAIMRSNWSKASGYSVRCVKD
jgi:uncharacterized protein (TIGR02145 family)